MNSLLRSRKQCFYCGHKTSEAVPRHSHNWQCESCQAVNYLDENGEITDPPVEEVASSQQAAQQFARPASGATDLNLFCNTCLKNQQILTQLLANYLPSAADPSYAKREAQYPQYKKELEERYPQVCRNCEPRVRERLRESGYAAKADHLKRLMQRSRQRRNARSWGWRSLLVRAGGVGLSLSLAGHFVWTLSVILLRLEHATHYAEDSADMSFLVCSRKLLSRHTTIVCTQLFSSIAGWALMLGLLTIWWNPKWHYKLEGREGRLVGLTRYYYRLQGPALGLRFGVWLFSQMLDDSMMIWVIHVISVPLIILLVILALASIKVDQRPLVSWEMDLPPLISEEPVFPTANTEMAYDSYGSVGRPVFPVSTLASQTTPQKRRGYSPVRSMSEADEMEWEPSQGVTQGFRPTSYADRYPQKITQPSPFHGRLPPAPSNHFLRKNVEEAPPPRDAIGLAPGHFDKPSNAVLTSPPSQGPEFVPPKFFPVQDRETDTGLETIFGKVFSLGDDDSGSTAQARDSKPNIRSYANSLPPAMQERSGISHDMGSFEFHLIAAFILLVLLAGWVIVGYLDIPALQLKLIMTGCVGVAAAVLLVSVSIGPKNEVGNVLLYLLQTLSAALLTGHRYQGGYSDGGRVDHLATALLAVMIGQEIYLTASRSTVQRPKEYGGVPIAEQVPQRNVRSETHLDPATQTTPDYRYRPGSQPFTPSIGQLDGTPASAADYTPSPFSSRRRSETLDSSASDSDASSVTSTVTSSSIHPSRFRESRKGPESMPGLGLGSLRLDDWGSAGTTGASSGMQTRSLRSGLLDTSNVRNQKRF